MHKPSASGGRNLLRGWRGPLLVGAVVVGAALAALSLVPHLPVLLWNATASAPLGFYRLTPAGDPQVGDWVASRPPQPLAVWLAAGGYLPTHVPLLKRVAAVAGQRICRRGDRILIDGRLAARALARDHHGVALPSWCGCRVLADGAVFLLNAPADSLDGRYFGATDTTELLGRAKPLWTWSVAR